MSRFITVNAPRIAAYVRAFRPLQRHSWPNPEVEAQLSEARVAGADPEVLVTEFAEALERLRETYPALRAFWKDAQLNFLGACQGLVRDSGVGDMERFIGLNDMHEEIVWSMQGAMYRRDDRRVMSERRALFDIVERQDVEGESRWLRTSKAPVFDGREVIGIIGAFDVIDAETARRLSATG